MDLPPKPPPKDAASSPPVYQIFIHFPWIDPSGVGIDPSYNRSPLQKTAQLFSISNLTVFQPEDLSLSCRKVHPRGIRTLEDNIHWIHETDIFTYIWGSKMDGENNGKPY